MLSGVIAQRIGEDQHEDFPRRTDTSLGCGRAWRDWFHVVMVLVLGLGWGTLTSAEPIAASTASVRPLLRVVTGYSSPFVKPPGTPVSGFSIEVWNEVARRIGVDTAWTILLTSATRRNLLPSPRAARILPSRRWPSALSGKQRSISACPISIRPADPGQQPRRKPALDTLRSLVSPAMLELVRRGPRRGVRARQCPVARRAQTQSSIPTWLRLFHPGRALGSDADHCDRRAWRPRHVAGA